MRRVRIVVYMAYMRHSIECARCGFDAYLRQRDNFFSYLFFYIDNFHKCSSYLDRFILKILCKLTNNFLNYEVLHQTILLGLGYKTFSKKLGANSCFVKHNNIFRTHLFAMKIYHIFLHTYPRNLWKFQVIWARTFLVMQILSSNISLDLSYHTFCKTLGSWQLFIGGEEIRGPHGPGSPHVNFEFCLNRFKAVAYAENFHGGFIQWHMMVICIWCVLFVTSQFDVIFMFSSEVCWHNKHILLHTLLLFL